MNQPPENVKTKAYWSFACYFAVTVIVIVLIGYLGLKVPFNENDNLKTKMANYEKERSLVTGFSVMMNKSRSMMLDSSRGDTSFINMQIADSLKRMQLLVNRDSVASKALYLNVITALNNFQASKQQLRSSAGIDQKLSDLKNQIDKKGAELNNLNEISRLSDSKQN